MDYWSKLVVMVNSINISDNSLLQSIWPMSEGVLKMTVELRVAVTRNNFDPEFI